MSAGYGTKKPDRAQILCEAHIVTAADVHAGSMLASQFALANVVSKLCGRGVYLVMWPNGTTAMVDAEPETTQWVDLLVNIFEGGLQDQIGPVGFGG